MEYLFFDIECCDGRHICEFGYVITNEQFEVLEQECILINPQKKFRLTGRKDKRDLILTHSEEEYKASLIFSEYYEKIKNLIEKENRKIFGFSMGNDIQFLRIACKRYGLEIIKFNNTYDVQKMIKKFSGNTISLEKAAMALEIPITKLLHESSYDAFLTMEIFKKLSEFDNQKFEASFSKYKEKNIYDELNEKINKLFQNPDSFGEEEIRKIITKFIKLSKQNGKIVNPALSEKTVCFSTLYEKERPIDCMSLMQQILNCGAHITLKASTCDYFIKHPLDEADDPHSRYHYIVQVLQSQTIKIIEWADLLTILNLTDASLKKLPLPMVGKSKNHFDNTNMSTNLGSLVCETQNNK